MKSTAHYHLVIDEPEELNRHQIESTSDYGNEPFGSCMVVRSNEDDTQHGPKHHHASHTNLFDRTV